MTLKNILEDLNKKDFLEKELKRLKEKYPNIPYEIHYNGLIVSNKNGKEHSYEDQPALIDLYTNGKIGLKAWYKNNKLHRDGDKPAVIMYDEKGKIVEVSYWFNGKQYLPFFNKESEDQTRRDLNYNLI